MVEWIALVLSVIALLLEREKISRFFIDLTDWRSRKKHEREGELFVKRLTRIEKKEDFNVVYFMLFFFFLFSSAVSGLLRLETIEELGVVSTLILSPLFLLSLRGLIKQYKKTQGGWLIITFMGFMFIWAFAGLGLFWGVITSVFFLLKLPVFWAGLSATPCVLVIIRLAQYHSQKTWAKDL